MPAVTARHFDAHSSRSHPVRIEAGEDGLWLRGELDAEPIPLGKVESSKHLSGVPRLLHLPDGSVCEVDDPAGLDNLLDEVGHNARHKQRLGNRWQKAILALLVAGCLATIGYRLSRSIFGNDLGEPSSQWIRLVSEQTLATLDHDWLMPSQLSPERQSELRNWFSVWHAPAESAPPYRLLFRRGGKTAVYSFSLPDGDIVITDEMIALTHDDRKILALLAYELGHLHYEHALQHVHAASFAAMLKGYLRISSEDVPALSNRLLQSPYSFDEEHQADEYAISMLRANSFQPNILVDALTLQMQDMRKPGDGMPRLLSAPANLLPQRIAALRKDM
ncbi:MAG TPA: M48 family metallopeptidase [Rhodocyclaceae bacterium]|nr:M48 family metallopeptidase [Rhodocyclaceae bacterium]